MVTQIFWLLFGAALGGLLVWLVMRTRLREATVRLSTKLEVEQKAGEEKLALVEQARSTLQETFSALAVDALRGNNDAFITLAQTKIEPLTDALQKIEETVVQLEASRNQSAGSLRAQLEELGKSVQSLNRALSTPDTVGNWGQIHLRRVVEMAGMLEHCDFEEQVSVTTDDGARQRPDVVVCLPGGARVVIDAKVPRTAYLEAARAEDDAQRRELLQRHAQHVRKHMTDLGAKKYWEQFSPAPEWVVMFVPHEPFLSAACGEDGRLIEDGFEKNRVMVATPLTLIALLYGFAAGWRQMKNEENAEKIAQLGRELYKRVGDFSAHFRGLGKALNAAVDGYNKTAGSLESRILPKARQFPALLGSGAPELERLATVDERARALHAPELLAP
jgi:DNA recombination protein RmuC